MSEPTFYRWALAFPIIAPALLTLVGLVPVIGAPFAALGGTLLMGIWVAGIPYLLFAVAMIGVMDRLSPSRLRRLCWWSPLLFAPAAAIGLLVATGFDNVLGSMAVGAACALAYGYFYVLVTVGIRMVLMRSGHVTSSPPSTDT